MINEVKIDLLKNETRTQYHIVFSSEHPMTDEDLSKVLIKWVNGLYGGNIESKDTTVNSQSGNQDKK